MSVIEGKFERPICESCKKPINKGEHYFPVNKPDGTTAKVHVACLEKGSPPA